MQELIEQLKDLQQAVAKACQQLDLEQLQSQLALLQKEAENPDFWQDQQKAQASMKQQAKLQARSSALARASATASLRASL